MIYKMKHPKYMVIGEPIAPAYPTIDAIVHPDLPVAPGEFTGMDCATLDDGEKTFLLVSRGTKETLASDGSILSDARVFVSFATLDSDPDAVPAPPKNLAAINKASTAIEVDAAGDHITVNGGFAYQVDELDKNFLLANNRLFSDDDVEDRLNFEAISFTADQKGFILAHSYRAEDIDTSNNGNNGDDNPVHSPFLSIHDVTNVPDADDEPVEQKLNKVLLFNMDLEAAMRASESNNPVVVSGVAAQGDYIIAAFENGFKFDPDQAKEGGKKGLEGLGAGAKGDHALIAVINTKTMGAGANSKVGRLGYDWRYAWYPLDKPSSKKKGAQMRVTDISIVNKGKKGDGLIYVMEADDQEFTNAATKKIYSIDLSHMLKEKKEEEKKPESTSWVDKFNKEAAEKKMTQEEKDAKAKADYAKDLAERWLPAPALKKTLVKDILPQLQQATQRLVPERLAMAVCKGGDIYVVSDNGGREYDHLAGETYFLKVE